MSHVEVFVTGIKIESSDQSPFWGLIKVTSSLVSRPLIRLGDLCTAKSTDQEHRAAIWPQPFESAQEPQKGTVKWLNTVSDQKPWSQLQSVNMQHVTTPCT